MILQTNIVNADLNNIKSFLLNVDFDRVDKSVKNNGFFSSYIVLMELWGV